MKKCFLSLLLIAVCGLGVNAQKGEKAVGLNLGYGSEIESVAIGVKFNYGVTDNIRLSPSFNYFVGNDFQSVWEINADVHYLFNASDKLAFYPLAGVTFVNWTFDAGFGSISETRFGVNLGAGAGYELTDALSLGLEVKYSIVSDFDQFVPAINLTYKF
jgi:outer membrane protein X